MASNSVAFPNSSISDKFFHLFRHRWTAWANVGEPMQLAPGKIEQIEGRACTVCGEVRYRGVEHVPAHRELKYT